VDVNSVLCKKYLHTNTTSGVERDVLSLLIVCFSLSIILFLSIHQLVEVTASSKNDTGNREKRVGNLKNKFESYVSAHCLD